VKTKTRKYEKQDFLKKIENFNTGISKSRLGCFTFWNARARFQQTMVVTSTTLTEIMECYTGI